MVASTIHIRGKNSSFLAAGYQWPINSEQRPESKGSRGVAVMYIQMATCHVSSSLGQASMPIANDLIIFRSTDSLVIFRFVACMLHVVAHNIRTVVETCTEQQAP